ncbi:hypothetical protein [Streptomyces sp. NPDC059639]|uniref:hypothetical protein n=1 Tax=Streptomyces sp. NPDC059639 TaxID=3346891 RepID=UPI0036CB947D
MSIAAYALPVLSGVMVALYVLAHAGAKAALFACTGILPPSTARRRRAEVIGARPCAGRRGASGWKGTSGPRE